MSDATLQLLCIVIVVGAFALWALRPDRPSDFEDHHEHGPFESK